MLEFAKRFEDRAWAIEGCNGIGHDIAIRLLADGESVVYVRRSGRHPHDRAAASFAAGADCGLAQKGPVAARPEHCSRRFALATSRARPDGEWQQGCSVTSNGSISGRRPPASSSGNRSPAPARSSRSALTDSVPRPGERDGDREVADRSTGARAGMLLK